jgi:hypothetical protein
MRITGVFGLAGVQKGVLLRAYRGCYNVRWPAGRTYIPPFSSPARKIRQRRDGSFTESRDVYVTDEVASITPLYKLLAEQQKHMHTQQMDTQRRLHEISRDHIGMMKEMMAYFDKSMRSMMETMNKANAAPIIPAQINLPPQPEFTPHNGHKNIVPPAFPATGQYVPTEAHKSGHGQVIAMPSMGPENFAEINFSKYIRPKREHNPPIIVAADKTTGKIVRISG